jgi:hypothetical protein
MSDIGFIIPILILALLWYMWYIEKPREQRRRSGLDAYRPLIQADEPEWNESDTPLLIDIDD